MPRFPHSDKSLLAAIDALWRSDSWNRIHRVNKFSHRKWTNRHYVVAHWNRTNQYLQLFRQPKTWISKMSLSSSSYLVYPAHRKLWNKKNVRAWDASNVAKHQYLSWVEDFLAAFSFMGTDCRLSSFTKPCSYFYEREILDMMMM